MIETVLSICVILYVENKTVNLSSFIQLDKLLLL